MNIRGGGRTTAREAIVPNRIRLLHNLQFRVGIAGKFRVPWQRLRAAGDKNSRETFNLQLPKGTTRVCPKLFNSNLPTFSFFSVSVPSPLLSPLAVLGMEKHFRSQTFPKLPFRRFFESKISRAGRNFKLEL